MLERTQKFASRVALVSVLVSLPSLIAVGVLTYAEKIPASDVVYVWLAIIILSIFWVFRHYQKMDEVRGYIEKVAQTRNIAHPPPEKPGSMAEIMGAINNLIQYWAETTSQLRAFAQALETIVESIPDPLIMLDSNRRIIRANITARALFGANMLNRDLASIIRDPWILEATNMVLGGGNSQQRELALTSPEKREFRVKIEPVMSSGPDGTKSILSFHDLTTLKRTEQTMADFVANASHELKTPLAALLGFIETLKGPAREDEEAKERFLNIMQEQTLRMNRLILDLLSLSKAEIDEHTLPKDQFDLKETVEDMLESLKMYAEPKNISLKVIIDKHLPMIIGEKDEISQVIQNLVDNAIKYGHPNSTATIEVKQSLQKPEDFPTWDGEVVAIKVSDEGEGMAREHIPRLTERFYRIQTHKDKGIGGTGLGLAIVKHVVNRHRGLMTIESEEGKGSTFSVYLRAIDSN